MGEDWVGMLQSQYRRLNDMTDELDAILSGGRPDDTTAFWRLRWAIMSLALTSLRTKRDAIADLERDGLSSTAEAIVRRSQDGQSAILAAYLNHCQQWDTEQEMADWPRYAAAARQMVSGMRQRRQWLERTLLPLLAKAQARRDRRPARDRERR